MRSFIDFSDRLSLRLTASLPGEEAHKKMAVEGRFTTPFLPNERTRQSAVLLLLYPYKGQIHLPLILRPRYEGVHGGQMAFPGGGMERSDKTLINTALREAQEEIGIKASDVHVIGTLSSLYIPPSNFLVLPVVGTINYRPDFYPDPREVERIFELSIQELQEENIGMQQRESKGIVFQAPHYLLQENKVWGATAMIISEFLSIISEKEP